MMRFKKKKCENPDQECSGGKAAMLPNPSLTHGFVSSKLGEDLGKSSQ